MTEQYLIKNTTREQREKIVKDSLGYDSIGCESGASEAMFEMYQPYIDGKMELNEITHQYQVNYISGEDMPKRGGCGMGR